MDQLSQGEQIIKQYKDAGVPDTMIDDYVHKTTDQYKSLGVPDDEIQKYWGQNKKPDFSDVQDHVTQNLAKAGYAPKYDGQTPAQAKDVWEAMDAGWQHGFTGLFLRGKKPDMEVSPDSNRFYKIASSLASMAGDLPAMLAGGAVGTSTGAIAGGFAGSVVPGVGTLAGFAGGGIVGAGAGAFAAPAAMRKMLMDQYEHPEGIRNASDFADRVVGATWEAAKGALTGAATSIAGPIGGAYLGTAGKLGAEVAAMTTVSSALEGHLPDSDDFINGAIAIGGLHAVSGSLPGKLRRIYADTGAKPADVLEQAQKDPAMRGELLSANSEIPQTPASPKPEVAEPTPAVDTAKLNLSDSEKEVLGTMKTPPEKDQPSTFSRMKDWWNDNTDYTTAAVQALKDTPDEKMGKDLLNVFPAWEDKLRGAKDFGKLGKYDNGESFNDVIRDVKGLDKKDPDSQFAKLEAYMVSRRIVDLADDRQIKQPGNIDVHRQVIADNEKVMQPIVNRLNKWSSMAIDHLADSGVITKDQADRIKEANKNHVPLWKIQQEDPITGITRGGAPAIPKTIGDSDLMLKNRPIENMLRNFESFVKSSEINRTKSTVYESILDGKVEQIRSVPANSDINENRDEYFIDGKRQVIEGPSDLIDSMKRLQGNDGALNVFGETLRGWAALVRAGTVNNPAFGGRHTFRNLISGATYSQTGMKPFEGLLSLPQVFMKSDMYQRMVMAGGAVSQIMKTNESYLDGEIYKLNNDAPFIGKAWNTLKSAGSFSHALIAASDNAVRLREFEGLVNKGATDLEAASGARRVLPDYQKAGLQQSALKAATAFLNVHMVSLDRMFEEFNDPDKRMGFIAKNLAYITSISMLFKAANHGDDTIDDLPDYMKNLYWVTRLDNWRPANSLAEALSVQHAYPNSVKMMKDGSYQVNDGTIVRIPKPFTNGVLFGSAIDSMLDQFSGKHPKAMEDWVKSVAGTVIVDPIPNAIAPTVEQFMNKNMFSGQSIVRQSMENKLPEMQYDRYTSETAKALGKLVSYMPLVKDIGPRDAKLGSPAVIDNYIHQWGGTLGQYAIQVADQGLRAAGIAPPVVKPASTLADIPFVKEFVVRFPSARPEQVENFLDRYSQADKVQNSIQAMYKQGDYHGAEALRNRYSQDMMRMKGIDKSIQNLNTQIQYVYANPNVSPTEKRQLIDTYMYQMVIQAKMGNESMDNWQKMSNSKAGNK